MWSFGFCAVLCVLFVVIETSASSGDIELNIEQGKLIGEWRTSLNGKPYGAFEGIPYARSPVGKRRFREPQRAKKWYGVWMAKKLSNICMQWADKSEKEIANILGNEDCLYINVYSPTPSKQASLPVIVYIHGGAFIFGSGTVYGPTYLMDSKVVYVSLNYRLGILGFMSTQDTALPGNLGLKDQNMALRWVRDNIHHFGGNPKSVTISGMSAGGASVHHHLMSPMSKGLFHKAISMSGTAFNQWTLQMGAREKALQVGDMMGCPTSSTTDMMDCLRHRSAFQIVRTTAHFMPWHHAPFSPFAPVIEPFINKDTTFISTHPYEVVRNGLAQDLPWLLSLTSQEGLYPAAEYLKKPTMLDYMAQQWDTLVPHLFDFNYTLPLDKHTDAASKIKDYYFKGKDLSLETFPKLVDALSDRCFNVDLIKTVKLQASLGKQPLYMYYFTYRGATSLSQAISGQDTNYGVSHGDDTSYIIDTDYMDPTKTPEDLEMIKTMTTLWVTFAQDGVPHLKVKWPPIGKKKELAYLDIGGPQKLEMKNWVHREDDATAFWSSLGLNENENFKNGYLKDEL